MLPATVAVGVVGGYLGIGVVAGGVVTVLCCRRTLDDLTSGIFDDRVVDYHLSARGTSYYSAPESREGVVCGPEVFSNGEAHGGVLGSDAVEISVDREFDCHMVHADARVTENYCHSFFDSERLSFGHCDVAVHVDRASCLPDSADLAGNRLHRRNVRIRFRIRSGIGGRGRLVA